MKKQRKNSQVKPGWCLTNDSLEVHWKSTSKGLVADRIRYLGYDFFAPWALADFERKAIKSEAS